MMDFNIEPFQLSSALLGVVATRLLRRLCTSCRVAHTPSDHDLDTISKTRAQVAGKKIYRPGNGCDKCIQTGYSGRVGVYELLVLDDELKELIVKTQDANVIKKKAISKGMMTLRDSAIDRVLAGITSIEEAINKTQTEEIDVGESVPPPASPAQ
jgi:general secretion pathway protein E